MAMAGPPAPLALAVIAGTIVKLQPGLLVVWMVLTRRYRAAVITIAALGAVAAIGFLIAPDLWRGFVERVVRQVSGAALTVPANFAPASIASFAGA